MCPAYYQQCFLHIVPRNEASLYKLLHQGTPLKGSHARDLSLLKKKLDLLFTLCDCQQASFFIEFDSLQESR